MTELASSRTSGVNIDPEAPVDTGVFGGCRSRCSGVGTGMTRNGSALAQ